MISGSELRKGIIIELEDKLYQVIEYHHIKMKRTALAKVKLRDIRGGHTIEQSFQSDQKFVRARLVFTDVQYLYNDGNLYYFMDKETFEQTPIDANQLGDSVNYLKDGMSLQVSKYKGELIGVEMPITVELEVTDTEVAGPGFRLDFDSALVNRAKLVLDQLSDQNTALLWEGASIPVVSALAEASGAEPLLVGFGREEDRIHAVNESFSIEQFRDGFLYAALFLASL